ncbi:monofunctional riboflavin biosynthesis protein RIBA 3, chloroplastic isoform X2 [Arachis hypogaea]
MKLVDGVSRCSAGRWSEIKLLSFSSHSYRTSVDLKDKWRNLLKASFAQAPADEGAFRRAGYTEASVDRVSPAGLPPVSVLSALVNDEDGSMSSLPTLTNLALEYNFPIVSITDLISSVKKEKEDMYPEME